MKTLQIMILSLLIATSSYAFGDRERNFLYGLGAGAILAHVIDNDGFRVHKTVHIDNHRPYIEHRPHIDHRPYVQHQPRYERPHYASKKAHRELKREIRRHKKALKRIEKHYSRGSKRRYIESKIDLFLYKSNISIMSLLTRVLLNPVLLLVLFLLTFVTILILFI